MMNVYDELTKIWGNITRDENIKDINFDIRLHKRLLDIFKVGDYFYLLLNVRRQAFELVSPEIENVLGYSAADIDLPAFVNLIHQDDMPVFLNFEAAVENFFNTIPATKYFDYKVQYDIRFRKSDSSYIRLLHQMVIVQHEAEDIRTFLVYTDISNLKKELQPALSFIGMEGEPSYINVDVQNIFKPVKQIFTSREREILKALANGMNSIEISEMLNISKLTVDSHRKNMLKKADAKSTNEIIRLAFDKGWV